jgi:hypothetical protein
VTDPDIVTFPLTTIGCGSQPATVAVRRIGDQPISWTQLDLQDCAGSVQVVTPVLPVALFEGQDAAVPFQVQLVPAQTGFVDCTMLLEPDHPDAGAATVGVQGVGTTELQRTDFFQQAPQFEADILFVVDNSGSMQDEQDSLIAGFEGFIAKAAAWEVDYHIGVITTDVYGGGGNLVENPLKWVDSDSWPFFAEMASVGIQGSGDEQGLRTAWMALQAPKLIPGGTNHGFLRNDALLAIVWISDEDDHSTAPVGGYVDFFKGLRPEGKVRGYAVVGDPLWDSPEEDGGCGGGAGNAGVFGPNQGALAGDRYVKAAESLGGQWFSICAFGSETSGAPILDQIGADAFEPVHRFALSEPPDSTTIEVLVNDVICASGWAWDAATNEVVFALEGGACFPGPGAGITVNYEPVCFDPIGG